MGTEHEKLIGEFCAAWERRDPDELAGYFTDDAVYHNIPMAAITGRDAIRQTIEMIGGGAQGAEFEMLHIASAGNVVHTERVDRFVIGGKQVAIPVAGVFEVTGGKISAWRDYFDLTTFTKQMG